MSDADARRLDIITMGRASVDLYGQQIGSRLEDITSFAKSVGGCPANIAIGTARLGLRSALLTRVGDEQMGRFIREQMQREGVSVDGLVTDPARLTALAILSVENDRSFPLLFYRENCADMALSQGDVDAGFIASARALVVTGTHFSRPNTDAAQRKAMRLIKEAGGKVVLDIDYRPNLWGLAGHAAGDNRYIASERVSNQMKTVLADCNLIVGTEEEVLIASGESELLAALKTIRALSPATIVLKRGPMGCIVYEGPIPDDLEDGIVGEGFPIEVYNVLGAGDAFMSGFLRGWLGGESLTTAATWANACGAFAVSRLLCSPEIPSFEELQFFLKHGSPHRALRKDEAINHVHWATNRRRDIPSLMAFACDHRIQLEDIARKAGADPSRIATFKVLAVKAAAQVAAGRDGYGMLIDEKHGREAMFEFARSSLTWLGRPVELPGSRPLRFEFSQDIGSGAEIATALQNIRQAMRNAGYADGSWTLVVSNYMSPIPSSTGFRYSESGYTRQSTGGCGFWNADANYANSTLLPKINQTIAEAVTASGVAGVKSINYATAFNGRRLCENTVGLYEEKGLSHWTNTGAVDKTEWINTIRTATATGNYYIQESLHPNYWGEKALRNCVRQAWNGGAVRGGSCVRAGNGLNAVGEPLMTLQ